MGRQAIEGERGFLAEWEQGYYALPPRLGLSPQPPPDLAPDPFDRVIKINEAERIDREALEARLGRGGYVVGAAWDEGNMVHAIRKFGGTTMGWRFGDG